MLRHGFEQWRNFTPALRNKFLFKRTQASFRGDGYQGLAKAWRETPAVKASEHLLLLCKGRVREGGRGVRALGIWIEGHEVRCWTGWLDLGRTAARAMLAAISVTWVKSDRAR